MPVGGPLLLMITYIYQSFITVMMSISSISWHFKVNADISILDKSVILGLPSCVFAGYSVLTHANDSLTYWLPDRIKSINCLWKVFYDWVCQVLTENAQKVY